MEDVLTDTASSQDRKQASQAKSRGKSEMTSKRSTVDNQPTLKARLVIGTSYERLKMPQRESRSFLREMDLGEDEG